jgi:hypothetical protein
MRLADRQTRRVVAGPPRGSGGHAARQLPREVLPGDAAHGEPDINRLPEAYDGRCNASRGRADRSTVLGRAIAGDSQTLTGGFGGGPGVADH